MHAKLFGGFVAALLLVVLSAAPAPAQSCTACPGSSYESCHYDFPLLWRFCAHFSSHGQCLVEPPLPFSFSTYEYHSHCPYAPAPALLGFASLTQRAKLEDNAGTVPVP